MGTIRKDHTQIISNKEQSRELASKQIVTKDSAIFAGLPVMPVQSLIAAESPTSWSKLRTPPDRSKSTLFT